MDKSEIRKHILGIREAIPDDERMRKNSAISERLFALSEFIAAKSVLLYASFGSEVETMGIIQYCLARKTVVSLPRINSKSGHLDIYRILDMRALVPGYRGIPEPPPTPETKITIHDIDLVVTPGVAFDESCNRIGYGKGYYDKLLGPALVTKSGHKPFFVGLAFEEQIVSSIYCGPYDINMDAVISDKRTIYRHGS
jgi:5-formyltetrahydrofolate cyclo-ligase